MSRSELDFHRAVIEEMRRAIHDAEAYGWLRPLGRIRELVDEYERRIEQQPDGEGQKA